MRIADVPQPPDALDQTKALLGCSSVAHLMKQRRQMGAALRKPYTAKAQLLLHKGSSACLQVWQASGTSAERASHTAADAGGVVL
jgi:hypothetical protein